MTYDAHFRAVAATARRLLDEVGIQKGDCIAIAMRNFPEWPVAFWASVAVGAVAVPLNAWWTGTELEYGLADSGAKVLFCDEERLERLAPHLRSLNLEAVIVARAESALEEGASLAAAAAGLFRCKSLKDWWWRQSGANLSPAQIPCSAGKYREFSHSGLRSYSAFS